MCFTNVVNFLPKSCMIMALLGAFYAPPRSPINYISKPNAFARLKSSTKLWSTKGFADTIDLTPEAALEAYDAQAETAFQLMKRKNHDYDEAWREMRISSYTDLILTKLQRIKEIENLGGATLVSEGIDANYMDIINYAVFGVVKLNEAT